MIDPNWSLVDLDPRTWRNIGRFFDPGLYIRASQPGERGLFVLHDGGQIKRVVDTGRGVRRDLALDVVADPQALAQQLYERGEWERVHVIDRRHLASVAREAQATPRRELTLDAYYRMVYHLLWNGSAGYVSVPPHPGHWHGWTYEAIASFVGRLPAAATLALGVLDGPELSIGLVVELQAGMIRRVTTFEALDVELGAAQVSAGFLERLWVALEQRFAPPAGVLLCTQPAFEAWMAGANKIEQLREAERMGAVLWRLRGAEL
jgi:hypothetical protein